jgi:hypothetical protein
VLPNGNAYAMQLKVAQPTLRPNVHPVKKLGNNSAQCAKSAVSIVDYNANVLAASTILAGLVQTYQN